jgi:hypothetical protein
VHTSNHTGMLTAAGTCMTLCSAICHIRTRPICPSYHEWMSSRDQDRWRRPDASPQPAESPDPPPEPAGPSAAEDVVEQGRHRPQVRWRQPVAIAAILGTVALSAAFAAGYALGNRHLRNSEAQLSGRGPVTLPAQPAGSRLSPSAVECTAQPALSLPTATPQPIVILTPVPPYFSGAQAYRPKPGGSAVYFACFNSK